MMTTTDHADDGKPVKRDLEGTISFLKTKRPIVDIKLNFLGELMKLSHDSQTALINVLQ